MGEREREIRIKINGRWDIAAKFIFSFCFIKEMIFALFPLLICFVSKLCKNPETQRNAHLLACHV
jgi:hypothetical protein